MPGPVVDQTGLRRYPYPGKFEGELKIAEYLYQMALDGTDEEIGSADELGWYGMIRLPDRAARISFIEEMERIATEAGDPPLTPEEKKMLLGLRGIIVLETGQGFFTVDWIDSKAELKRKWREIERAYEQFYREQEEAES